MNKKIYFSLFLLLVTFLIGIVGYKLLVGNHITILDCIYMTLITLSTVGFGEIFDLTTFPAARILTMILILMGMGNLLFLVSSFTSMLVDGRLNRMLWRRKVMKKIGSYSEHFIICGAGNTGRHIINELIRTKREYVIIEQDLAEVEVLKELFPDAAIIDGDAADDNILLSAGIEKAMGLASVLPTDKDNLFLTVTANQLNHDLRIISKLINLENRDKLIRAGAASIVPPNFIGALRLVSELIRPKVVGFLDIMLRDKHNLRVEEIDVGEKSWVIGKTLQDLQIRQKVGIQVIAIETAKTGKFNYYPEGKTLVEKNDTLVVIGEPDRYKKFVAFVKKK
jgi:voltage-gated potassium channel